MELLSNQAEERLPFLPFRLSPCLCVLVCLCACLSVPLYVCMLCTYVHCTEQTLDLGSNSLSGILPPSLSSLNKLTCVTLYTTHCLCPPFALRLGSCSR
jgi:hypothetical protein